MYVKKKNEKTIKLGHLELDLARLNSMWRDIQDIVQIYPDIRPGKNEKMKKVDYLDLDLSRSDLIWRDIQQIAQIVPDTCMEN